MNTIDNSPFDVRVVGDGHELDAAVAMMRDYVAWVTAMSGVRLTDAPGAALGELKATSEFYSPPVGQLILATDGDRTVGVAGMRIVDEDVATIRRCYVDPTERRRGVGRRLVSAALAEAERLGISRVRAYVTPAAAPAVERLVEALGYSIGTSGRDRALSGVIELDIAAGEVNPMLYTSPEYVAVVEAERRRRLPLRRKTTPTAR